MPSTREIKQLTKQLRDILSAPDKSKEAELLIEDEIKKCARSKSMTEPIITMTNKTNITLNNQNKK